MIRLIRLALALAVGAGAGSANRCEAAMATRVLVIGCDGFGSLGFTSTNAPVLHRMMRDGAFTLRARGVLPTSSSPNWASMIMGAGPEQHGITSNDWQPDKFEIAPIAMGSGGIFPTIFGVLREQKPKFYIACVHDWDGFARLLEPKAPNLIENVKGSAATTARAIEVIQQPKPDFMFIHFDDVDHAGHKFGWKSDAYFEAVEQVDGYIGKILETLDKTGLRKKTLVIMTADHGGKGTSHGDPIQEELEIPWILSGPGVRSGHEIQTAVNTYDLAPTIAWVLKVNPHPAWIGKPIKDAFIPTP